MYQNLFIQLPIDEHLGHFDFLAIMNIVAMNSQVKGSTWKACGYMFSFYLTV